MSALLRMKMAAEEEKRRKKFNENSGYDLSKEEYRKMENAEASKRNQAAEQAEEGYQSRKSKMISEGRPSGGMEEALKTEDGDSSGGNNRAKIGAAKELLSQAGLSGQNTENTSMGAAGGAMQGALAGSAFGWQGALVGGAVGGLSGGLQAKAARKRRLAEIEANKFRELGAIEERKGKQINDAIENLNQAFQRSLLSSGNLTLF